MDNESNPVVLHLQHAYRWLKYAAATILAVTLAFHLVRVHNGANSCQAYTIGPRFNTLSASKAGSSYSGNGHWYLDEWHQTGCIAHQFFNSRGSKLKPCLQQHESITFLGDSRARQLFQALVQQLTQLSTSVS
eukprot:m.151625 g.151625  ORF g.151625 m.151625 type:complete len:133 (-) comp16343_c0_seq1:2574-2972(-)